jgi:hypothetical protein
LARLDAIELRSAKAIEQALANLPADQVTIQATMDEVSLLGERLHTIEERYKLHGKPDKK